MTDNNLMLQDAEGEEGDEEDENDPDYDPNKVSSIKALHNDFHLA